MKISTTLAYEGDPARYTRRAKDLESAGVDLVWSGEIYGFDLVSSLAYLAGVTTTLELMTGIIPVYTRTPALIAQTAATIDSLSGGRFHLGLGTSGPQVIEGWHGVPFDKPLQRTRETIEVCRKVWTRESLTYDGRTIKLPLPPEQGTGFGKPFGKTNGSRNAALLVNGTVRRPGFLIGPKGVPPRKRPPTSSAKVRCSRCLTGGISTSTRPPTTTSSEEKPPN